MSSKATILRPTLLLALSLSWVGCASSGLRGLSQEFPTKWGDLAAPPTLEDHRLFIYLKQTGQEGQTEGTILVCVAENKEKFEILQHLAGRVVESAAANKPIAVIGRPVKGEWNEFAEGVDFEIYAVGYFNPRGQKYQTIITTYGTHLRDLVGSVSWGNFIQTLGKKALDAAL